MCCESGSNFILLYVEIQLFQHHLLKRLFFTPLNYHDNLVEEQLTIIVWAAF